MNFTQKCVLPLYIMNNTTLLVRAKCGVFYFSLFDNITNTILNKVMFIIIDMYNKIKVNIILINITSNPRDKLDELKATHTYAFFISYVL